METRQDRLVIFWLILALVLFIYFIIPIRDDSHGNLCFSWSGFTNQTFALGYEQTIWMSLYHVYIVLAGCALSPTDSPHFIALLIQYVGIAVLAFGFIGIIDSGSSEGSARMKLSKVVVTSWFCVNLLIALFLQHANEFPSEIPLAFQYFRVVAYSLGSFMAITIGMTDLLRIRLLGKEPETAATG